MKLKQLKTRFIKRGAIYFVILVAITAGCYFVYDEDESLLDQVTTLKGKVSAAEGQASLLTKQLENASDAKLYYQIFTNSPQGNAENYRRDYAKNILGILRDENHLLDLKLSMEPFKKANGDYEKPTVALFISKVTVQFSANTDIDALNFMEGIGTKFPGNIEIVSYKLQRVIDISENPVVAANQAATINATVTGEIVFEWQGIQDNPDYTKSMQKAPTQPNAGGPPNG